MLKGQDIAIINKILIKQKDGVNIEFKTIAHELYISQSEVSKSILRLAKTKLITRNEDNSLILHKSDILEFFIHGFKYIFPAEINIATRGVATAYSPPIIKKYMLNEESYVWPYSHGKNKGLALTPIYKTLPNALDRFPDEDFYLIMSALDLKRIGGDRNHKISNEILANYFQG